MATLKIIRDWKYFVMCFGEDKHRYKYNDIFLCSDTKLNDTSGLYCVTKTVTRIENNLKRRNICHTR